MTKWGYSSVVEGLLSMHKSLGTNPQHWKCKMIQRTETQGLQMANYYLRSQKGTTISAQENRNKSSYIWILYVKNSLGNGWEKPERVGGRRRESRIRREKGIIKYCSFRQDKKWHLGVQQNTERGFPIWIIGSPLCANTMLISSKLSHLVFTGDIHVPIPRMGTERVKQSKLHAYHHIFRRLQGHSMNQFWL